MVPVRRRIRRARLATTNPPGPALLLVAAALSVLLGVGLVAAVPHRAQGATTAVVRPLAPATYADAGVLAHGVARYWGSPVTTGVDSPVVAMAATPDGRGYWLAAASGQIYTYGDAPNRGSAVGLPLRSPVVGIARTANGQGYWLVTAAGGVYPYGNARNWGARPVGTVTAPIVAIVATPDGRGYWLVNTRGGVESYGDARWHGGLARRGLPSAIVGMATTKDGKGYWLVTAGGQIFPFGDAPKLRWTHGSDFTTSVAGIAALPSGKGLWIVADNGQVQSYGAAGYYGSNAAAFPVQPDVDVTSTPTGRGYWLLEPDAFPTSFAAPAGGSALGEAIVAVASSNVMGDGSAGGFCNPYGPCEPWCALFATAVWEAAGVDISRFAFVGDIYHWAAAYTRVLAPSALPSPGDAVLYGTGPATVATAVHVGIVAQVWPDGFIDTVEGDAGPAPVGHLGVIINGPFLANQSLDYNGFPIFGYAVP